VIYWLLSLTALAVLLVIGWLVWQKWISPWSAIRELIGDIRRLRRPRTYLISGANAPRQVALALENLFERQQELEEQLSERVSGTQTIVTAMQEGLLVVDANRRIRLVNRAFRELFNVPENVGRSTLLEVVRNADIDRLTMKTLETGEPQRQELQVTGGPNGSPQFMELSAVATRNDSGAITGAAVLFHDISQLKQADEVRRDFVANVSHELRTPLSILRGYIETLLDYSELSGDELNRILEVMKKHSDRLTALTDDLLALARLESSQPKLKVEDVRLSELFAGIVRDWGKRFAEKQLRIEVNVVPASSSISADPARLQEILYNLVDNAVKYSHPGGKIRLTAIERNQHTEIAISDTGIGIPEADIPRIFERFYRADKARSRELGGTGLGLSIVKHIVQMHGGSVKAESAAGHGTTIRVSLPLQQERTTGAVTES